MRTSIRTKRNTWISRFFQVKEISLLIIQEEDYRIKQENSKETTTEPEVELPLLPPPSSQFYRERANENEIREWGAAKAKKEEMIMDFKVFCF